MEAFLDLLRDALKKQKDTLLRVIPTMTFQDVYLDIDSIYSDKFI